MYGLILFCLIYLLILYRSALAEKRINACLNNKSIISFTHLPEEIRFELADMSRKQQFKIEREIKIYAYAPPFYILIPKFTQLQLEQKNETW